MTASDNPFRQRLVVLFDGTWNDHEDKTNVFRLAGSLHDRDGAISQRFFYDPGVGTGRWDRIRGGLTGYGLDRNLQQGYEWLCRRYAEGDEIFLFGFSRGAYTARSLGGMIRKCGLLRIVTPELLKEATQLYRNRKFKPDGPECAAFRKQYSRDAVIDFLGVWDTVGALGVPGSVISRKKYRWHDTELSRIIRRAYQALALDEHRAAYESVPWTTPTGQKKPQNIEVEQRWFIGAHANVGGGYKDSTLAEIALEWMQRKALAAGLKLDLIKAKPEAFRREPVDSLKEFMFGIYYWYRRIFHGQARHHRAFDRDSEGRKAVNVTVDDSVWQRWHAFEKYRPRTLTDANCEPPDKKAVA
ncbi:MAG TPA: DUF2235 domain-containing protein [Gammaproteobacteria bacterium]